MKTKLPKSHSCITHHNAHSNTPFFQKSVQDGYLSKITEQENLFFSPKLIQPKLSIGHAGDKYEKEADQIADQVVQKLADKKNSTSADAASIDQPSNSFNRSPLINNTVNSFHTVQRKCTTCEQEGELKLEGEEKNIRSGQKEPPALQPLADSPNDNSIWRKCAACGKQELIQAKGEGPITPTDTLESQLSATSGTGTAMPSSTRTDMEEAFGADFSGVQLHTNSSAVQMNEQLGARAFTTGQDIYFNKGEYQPESNEGKRLLAHELTHTIQQGAVDSKASIQRGPSRIQRFVSSEHRSLGDLNADETPIDFPEGTLFEGSPPLSYGEIVALSGDFYGSFENLANENFIDKEGQVVPDSRERKIDEIQHLKRLFQVEAEIRAEGREPEGLDMGNVEHDGESLEGFEKTTEGRYLALAEENFPHFTVADVNNIGTWMKGHQLALEEAFAAGIIDNTQGKLLALARNAAANHFLTDAFASGHMRVPRSDIDRYYRELMGEVGPGLVDAVLEQLPEDIDFTIDLRPFIPSSVRSIIEQFPELDKYLDYSINIELRSRVRAAIEPYLKDFTEMMRDVVGPKLGGLVSKWLHDTDNENGLLVTNKAGGRWIAYGDSSLDKAPPAGVSVNTTNRAEAQKAVQADRQEVEEMFVLGQKSKEEQSEDVDPGTVPETIFFDFDQPKMENNANALSLLGKVQLDSLAAYLNSVNGVKVVLEGWADSRGSRAYNKGLAGRRVSAVIAYLSKAGVPSEKIGDPIIHGEPLAPTNATNHALFRRVSIRLTGTPTPQKQEENATPSAPIPEPFAATQFLPQVESDNTAMAPYDWCNLNEDQKALLRNGMKPTVKGGLKSLLEASVQDSLPESYEVDFTIPVPFLDDIHIHEEIPIKETIMTIASPIIDGAIDAVMSDVVLGNLLDGTCSFSD